MPHASSRFELPIDMLRLAITDRAALVALFRATGGENWKNCKNWNTDTRLSTWFGVGISDQGRVMSLMLVSNNLQGTAMPLVLFMDCAFCNPCG